MHNKSWTDAQNKEAIKNAKRCAKNKSIVRSGPFNNLYELKLPLTPTRNLSSPCVVVPTWHWPLNNQLWDLKMMEQILFETLLFSVMT